MSHRVNTKATICCPRCGQVAPVGDLLVSHTEAHYDTEKKTSMLRLAIQRYIDTPRHNCVIPVPSDGLRPVDRFIKHSALDDMGETTDV